MNTKILYEQDFNAVKIELILILLQSYVVIG